MIGKLPRNIQILTLEPWKEGYVLLRLEHLFEVGESPKYSFRTEVNLKVIHDSLSTIFYNPFNLNCSYDYIHFRMYFQDSI